MHDRQYGSVYATIAFAPGVVAGIPINVGAGILGIRDKKTLDDPKISEKEAIEAYQGYISGFSGSFTAVAGIGGSVGLSEAGIIAEGLSSGSITLGITIGYTFFVGTIRD